MAHNQIPLMQQPGFVYRAHKHIVARNIKVGDIVLDKRHGAEDERWTVEEVEATTGLVRVKFRGRNRSTVLALPAERIWIAREEWRNE